jgi:SAM-dependent methyltransferase
LHHLPMQEALLQWSRALRPGGVLLVLDLYRQTSLWQALSNPAAMLLSSLLTLVHDGRLCEPAEVRRAWAEHGKHDVYAALPEVTWVCAQLLPGARVRSHLLWRYSIVWSKP